jgi:outer membrane protein assembly factor BamB
MKFETDRRGLVKLSGFALASSAFVPVVSASSDGWQTPRGDTANTAATDTGPQDGVTSDWSVNIDVIGTPVVIDGTVYAATSDGVGAFDASNGDRLWLHDLGDVAAPVSYSDGAVYVTAGASTYSIDAETGEQQWSRRGTGASASTPVAVDGTVYVGLSSTLYALGAQTGTVLWDESLNSPLAGAPAVRDGTVYAATQEGNVYGFEADGGLEWVADAGASVAGAPVATGDGVFVVGGRGDVVSLETSNGDENWRESLTTSVSASPAVDDDHVYVATDDGTVHALRTSSGWEDWVFESDGTGAAPAVAGDTVYFVSDGALYAIDSSNGNERWRHDRVSGSPAVVGTDIFFGDGGLRRLTGTFPSPDTAVVSASVDSDTVGVGENVGVTAEVENVGDAEGTHQAALYVDGESVEFRDVDVSPGETAEITFSLGFDEAGERSVSVDDVEAGDVEVVGEETDAAPEPGDVDRNGTEEGTNSTDQDNEGSEGLPGFGAPAAVAATACVALKRLMPSDEDS